MRRNSKMEKEVITSETEIIDVLSEILGLLMEIVKYNYHDLSEDDLRKIASAASQAEDMHKLVNLFGKGLKLILVSSKDLDKFIESKQTIFDPSLDGDNCKFVVLPETGTCVISVRGY